jgi:glycosyltransferase involved in cell wall biosynthesis
LITIFISIPWFYPAFRAGGPVQSVANMVTELNEGYDFYIFCGNKDLNDISLDNIETGKWVPFNNHTKIWYAEDKERSCTLTQLVESIKPHHILIIGLYSWHFNIVPLLFCKSASKILSVRGMLHDGALAQKSAKKKIFIGLFKLFGLQHRLSFHATDETEKNIIYARMGEHVKVFVAGNFPRRFTRSGSLQKQKGSLQMLSVALISPMKNHLLVLQSLRYCKAVIDYLICGPVKDMSYWQQCLEQIKQLPANIKVVYNGEVQPGEVEEQMSRGHIFILPSKSENFGHAFYEALSAGKPVITSHFTPWNDLQNNKAGINIDLSTQSIIDSIDYFSAMDQDTYNEWSIASSAYAGKSIDLTSLKNSYREMFAASRQPD